MTWSKVLRWIVLIVSASASARRRRATRPGRSPWPTGGRGAIRLAAVVLAAVVPARAAGQYPEQTLLDPPTRQFAPLTQQSASSVCALKPDCNPNVTLMLAAPGAHIRYLDGPTAWYFAQDSSETSARSIFTAIQIAAVPSYLAAGMLTYMVSDTGWYCWGRWYVCAPVTVAFPVLVPAGVSTLAGADFLDGLLGSAAGFGVGLTAVYCCGLLPGIVVGSVTSGLATVWLHGRRQ